jgi:cell division protein ZapA
MDSSSTRVSVRVFGEDYTILGEAEPSTILEIARMVDERLKELEQAMPQASRERLAVLCAMNLADELLQSLSLEKTSANPIAEEKTKKIISLLEEGIIGDSYS